MPPLPRADKPKRKKPPKAILFNIDDTQYPSVSRCGKSLGWRITDSHDNNLLFWCDSNVGIEYCLTLHPWQFVNHFPGTFALSRKVELSRNFDRAQKLFPEFYNFHPLSFILPTQFSDLQNFMQSVSLSKRTFIVKPDLGAQGRGIFLVQDPDDLLGYPETSIAQRYIPPSLLSGLKYDFRIYVLLTSIDPLRVYIYNEGMARFCTEPYRKPRSHNLNEKFSHLTNYSLNKKNENFEVSDSGHKRSLSTVFQELARNGVDIITLQTKIDELIVLTIACAQPFIAHNYRSSVKADDGKSRCFEILGFDVMLDKRMKPWLLEVNHSPSLLCESPFDRELKDSLIVGALKIMDFDPRFKKKTIQCERAKTQRRISGQPDLETAQLWNPQRELEIAGTTQWRLIYPVSGNPCLAERYDRVLRVIQSLPVDGSVETITSQKRKAAIQLALQEKEQKKQVVVNRTPRSELLLREAKLAKLRCDAKREKAERLQFAKVVIQELGFKK